LNGSGNSLSGHSQTLQSLRRHIPSSGQKGQSHHSLTLQNKRKNTLLRTGEPLFQNFILM